MSDSTLPMSVRARASDKIYDAVAARGVDIPTAMYVLKRLQTFIRIGLLGRDVSVSFLAPDSASADAAVAGLEEFAKVATRLWEMQPARVIREAHDDGFIIHFDAVRPDRVARRVGGNPPL